MSFELIGTLIVKEETVKVSDKFQKREFVIEVVNEKNAEWSDFVKFQSVQDRVSIIDPFNLGDKIKVSFNIKGNRWERDGRVNYFTNLDAWRVEKVEDNDNELPSSPSIPLPDQLDELPPSEQEDEFPF
ncbi:DUF3127 domain-containing protein [Thermophagus xiamenensis]|jgi:hypothetical protein|uniref:DUF3127 domain-containing protein n=1 Tax=Thermophagus xiamenensis TaxID=385682 RepID=A0A1I2EWV8_9BACT|nr:DUF3127 domain-containing protein [Thermophagus xiamenensis]SFE97604.1 protein of unknown function [Thermophagus xiamenensis]